MGVALSIFGTVTKLLNIPLLSVTTNVVATAVGSNTGMPPYIDELAYFLSLHATGTSSVMCVLCAADKDAQIGLAASTSLLIAALVSIAEARYI